MNVTTGHIRTNLMGASHRPFQVHIQLAPFQDTDWDLTCRIIAEEAYYTAALLDGKIPDQLVHRLVEHNLHLIPKNWLECALYCTCPKTLTPCNHIYSAIKEFQLLYSDNPFLLFEFRGISRSTLLSRIRKIRKVIIMTEHKQPPILNSNTQSVKNENKLMDSVHRLPAELLKKINNPAFWKKDISLYTALLPIYNQVSKAVENEVKRK